MKLEPPEIDAIAVAVAAALGRQADAGRHLDERLGYTEPEAASLLSVPPHVLRDCRLRGEISARKVGRCYIYSRRELVEFLNKREPR